MLHGYLGTWYVLHGYLGTWYVLHGYLGTWYVLHGYLGTCFLLHGYGSQSSAMTSSLHKSIHPPELGINPSKAAGGCPCGGVIKNSCMRNVLTLCNAFVNITTAYVRDPQCLAGKRCNNNSLFHGSKKAYIK